ncbi:unnamed protein product [marine sediment metagenome]|uniref:Uncharacterized protein n=1 Tax=marine sediment metagenome TaxID=412755 RepID=X0TWT6_9ZZZZ
MEQKEKINFDAEVSAPMKDPELSEKTLVAKNAVIDIPFQCELHWEDGVFYLRFEDDAFNKFKQSVGMK